MDTDLVYQRQWRKSELTLNAIAEHLGKVSKRSWVLNECVTRVPDTLEAARELLNFGLRGANLETLMAIHTCDNDKFVTPDMEDDWQVLNDNVNLGHVSKLCFLTAFTKDTSNSINKKQYIDYINNI